MRHAGLALYRRSRLTSNVRPHNTTMHVHLRVGESSSGEPVFEPVHVRPLGGRRYVVEYTPGLAYEVAAGDEVELADDGAYTVTKRAGNVAVRVLSAASLASFEAALTSEVRAALGGRLDGRIDRGLAYAVPVQIGFPAIERVFQNFVAATPGATWEYGNVYAEDGTPLNWWNAA
jgi:hypothetical protein